MHSQNIYQVRDIFNDVRRFFDLIISTTVPGLILKKGKRFEQRMKVWFGNDFNRS